MTVDCKDCEETQSLFTFNGKVLGARACALHADMFRAKFGMKGYAERNPTQCTECMSEIASPAGVFFFRLQLDDGWHNFGFFGCRADIEALFKHLRQVKATIADR